MFPAEDIWLESDNDGLAICAGGSIADAPTDALGQTYWERSLRAGGRADPLAGGGLGVIVNGDRTTTPALVRITVVSPDLNGDLAVNLVDVALFAGDYLAGTAARRSDFYWDGILNLLDLSILASLYGSNCP